MERRKSRQVYVGDIAIGGGSKITVQSMLNTKTVDTVATIAQINQLLGVGCDLVRLAVPNEDSAVALKAIASQVDTPLIADIHYNYKLAHMAIDSGAKKIRMNPGNMQNYAEIADLAKHMVDQNIPVRVGVNSGSLHPKYEGMSEVEALAMSALDCAEIFDKCGQKNIVLAIKASDTMTMIKANEKVATLCDYPLHLGVTESGTIKSGLIKSSFGIGTLLNQGIGDTIRVSLSADVVQEVIAGKNILKMLGIRQDVVEVVSCPTCARTEIDVEGMANKIEQMTANINKNIKVSVLGCPLNGIGEGKNSDIGIAGGKEKSVILKGGEIFETVDSSIVFDRFMEIFGEIAKEK